MLLTYLRSLLRDHAAVDDVFQETLVTAWRNLHRFDHERPFAPWLRGIARNLVLAHHRRHRRLPAICEETVLAHLDRRLDEIGRRAGDTWDEKLEALDDCLDRLPDETRTLLDWHYRLELDTARIAARLDSNRETIKKRLQRARSRLLDCLTAKGVLGGGGPSPEPTT
jgi:RNA polymerase sigma-70 factor (ECF subfamily)